MAKTTPVIPFQPTHSQVPISIHDISEDRSRRLWEDGWALLAGGGCSPLGFEGPGPEGRRVIRLERLGLNVKDSEDGVLGGGRWWPESWRRKCPCGSWAVLGASVQDRRMGWVGEGCKHLRNVRLFFERYRNFFFLAGTAGVKGTLRRSGGLLLLAGGGC